MGYVILWESSPDYDEEKSSSIGENSKNYNKPKQLVIDGQQRLTALVAAMYGVEVQDNNYKNHEIKISYNPFNREFEVWTSAIGLDKNWISKISDVFLAKENNSLQKLRRSYVEGVNDARRKKNEPHLTVAEEDRIENNLNDLLALENFSIPILEISANANEQDVADIFVRVNSGGRNLVETDFIQTLISVYEKDVHDRITKFCLDSRTSQRNTSYNNIMKIDPQHLVRIAVGVGFRRARLKYAYMILRGKDLDTEKYSDETRIQNLTTFKDALDRAMNLNNLHDFLNCVSNAGFVSKEIIASSQAVIFSYVLYLIGKQDYRVDSVRLNRIISKWFFMVAITSYYTGSTETTVEKQFADLRKISNKDADGFIAYLERIIADKFTDGFFNQTLPNELLNVSSTGRTPAWYGYLASQIVLNIPMLFSTSSLMQYLIPGTSGTKSAVQKHHIFPKNHLTKIGYTSDRDRNQVANFTYLDHVTNNDISDSAPVEYIKRYKEKLGNNYKAHCENHALPENFENMDYNEFLEQRRVLMAQIIKRAFEKL